MSLAESVERRAKMGDQYQAPDFFWWEPEQLTRFFAHVHAVGLKDIYRIEAHLGTNADGHPDLHFRALHADAEKDGPAMEFNWSHPCPPDCPTPG